MISVNCYVFRRWSTILRGSGAETCRNWHLSWTVFYNLYFTERICWL